MAVYPPGRADGVEVRGSDLARLEADEFLNDTVIDLYIRCVHEGGWCRAILVWASPPGFMPRTDTSFPAWLYAQDLKRSMKFCRS